MSIDHTKELWTENLHAKNEHSRLSPGTYFHAVTPQMSENSRFTVEICGNSRARQVIEITP